MRRWSIRLDRTGESWHRVWLGPLDNPIAGQDPSDDNIAYNDSTTLARTWFWQSDFERWHHDFGAPYPTSDLAPIASPNFYGRFWAHSDSLAGMTFSVGTGIHLKTGPSPDPAEQIANHYEYVSPVFEESSIRYDGLPVLDPGFMARLCLECPLISIPGKDTCTRCGALIPRLDMSIYEAQRVIVLQTNQGKQLAVLLHDGSLVPLESVGPALQASLDQGLVMVDAVEPRAAIGDGATMPAALGLSPNGTQVVEKVTLSNRALFGERDRLIDRAAVSAGVMSTTTLPPPRQDFASVYSRATGRLFVVGGKDSTTGAALRDIWWQDVPSGEWLQVPLGEHELGKVLAATHTLDGRLWVLDETKKKGAATFVRLSRILPGTGDVDVLGTWARHKKFDRHWLVMDKDWSVLVVASSTQLRRHVVVRIDQAGPPPRANEVRFGRGALAFAPSVDTEGYSFPIQEQPNRLPITMRLQHLGGTPGHWQDLHQCF